MKIAVIIPSYRVRDHLLPLLARVGPEVAMIFVVDDACPEQSGKFVAERVTDPRVKVLFHTVNLGVGGAMKTGYRAAMQSGADIAVKLDGDGQMAPELIGRIVRPISEGRADYVKGNRFFSLQSVQGMPPIRIFGNSVLSFINKFTSGYWNLMDPTNGFTAIHCSVLARLPLDKIDNRYFFESDILFRLNTVRAVVCEIPMQAQYGDEESNLNIPEIIRDFPRKYALRFAKRVFYNYYLRDFNAASLELFCAVLLLSFGAIFGSMHWYLSVAQGVPATTGTVMLASLAVILGFQCLISAISFDVMNIPREPVHKLLELSPPEIRTEPAYPRVVGL